MFVPPLLLETGWSNIFLSLPPPSLFPLLLPSPPSFPLLSSQAPLAPPLIPGSSRGSSELLLSHILQPNSEGIRA